MDNRNRLEQKKLTQHHLGQKILTGTHHKKEGHHLALQVFDEQVFPKCNFLSPKFSPQKSFV